MIEEQVVNDAIRYLGGKKEDEEARSMLNAILQANRDVLLPRQVTAIFTLKETDPVLTFDGCEITLAGESIKKHFSGATEGLFSAFTLGVAFDRRVRELSLTRPSEAVALNALGSAYAERKADALLLEVRKEKEAEGFRTNFRFCPGYGDLDIHANAAIVAALGATKKIGLTVTEAGTLIPVKSIVGVTACIPQTR